MKKDPPTFAFVALSEPALPSEQKLASAVREYFGASTTLKVFKIESDEAQFSVADQTVSIALMKAPIPWGDLEGPAATSWLWRDATNELKSHKAHLIVLVTGGRGTLVERSIFLTKILAATSDSLQAVGVYWGHGSVVLSRALLREQAKGADLENLPIMAWIEFRVQRESDGKFSVLTTGLDYFECMDIEVVGSKREASEILRLVTSIARMELGGDVFADGDTVGPDADTKIKTRHLKSVWSRERNVLRVEY